eukprot:3695886-Rhodomonas_salina.1
MVSRRVWSCAGLRKCHRVWWDHVGYWVLTWGMVGPGDRKAEDRLNQSTASALDISHDKGGGEGEPTPGRASLGGGRSRSHSKVGARAQGRSAGLTRGLGVWERVMWYAARAVLRLQTHL